MKERKGTVAMIEDLIASPKTRAEGIALRIYQLRITQDSRRASILGSLEEAYRAGVGDGRGKKKEANRA